MSRSSHPGPTVRPQRRGIRCRPNTGSQGQRSFRVEAGRKVRLPEVQHLLLPGGGEGPAGPACSRPSLSTPVQRAAPQRDQQQFPFPLKATRSLSGAVSTFKRVQEHRPSFSRTPCLTGCSLTWADGAFLRGLLSPDINMLTQL